MFVNNLFKQLKDKQRFYPSLKVESSLFNVYQDKEQTLIYKENQTILDVLILYLFNAEFLNDEMYSNFEKQSYELKLEGLKDFNISLFDSLNDSIDKDKFLNQLFETKGICVRYYRKEDLYSFKNPKIKKVHFEGYYNFEGMYDKMDMLILFFLSTGHISIQEKNLLIIGYGQIKHRLLETS
jgi:hypothetical protein